MTVKVTLVDPSNQSIELYQATATIAVGATGLSDTIDLNGFTPFYLKLPDTWIPAVLSTSISFDGTVFSDVFDAGAEITLTGVTGKFIPIDYTKFVGVRYLKLRSGTSAAPVNQTATRLVTIFARPL
jgi:hypothetical protein